MDFSTVQHRQGEYNNWGTNSYNSGYQNWNNHQHNK